MAGRTVFQMDQTKPEDQIVCGHQQECGLDPDMDCTVYIFTSGLPQIPVEVTEKHAADFTIIAAQSV